MIEVPNASENSLSSGGDPPLPARIGRYRIERLLGRSGFGIAYLAIEDGTGRRVSLKMPTRGPSPGESIESYRRAAEILVQLKHPAIVPFKVECDENQPYFVADYIDATDLAQRPGRERLPHREVARIIATVAEALHAAHDRNLYHKGLRPANILVDAGGGIHILDFGLGLREYDDGLAADAVGQLYLSPEQARGEGHLVDGRSDTFSLGIVFCELLTGQRPFRTLQEIANADARPPRRIDAGVPRELDRICKEALHRGILDRYSTAADFAEDLRVWLEKGQVEPAPVPAPPVEPVLPPSAHAVFSYATEPDLPKALELSALLEARGIRCWIAARDIVAGDDYRISILDQIEKVDVLLLLLSWKSNTSRQVSSEVELAVSLGKKVVPILLDKIGPDQLHRSLRLHLPTAQWIKAWDLKSREVIPQLLPVFRKVLSSPLPAAAASRADPLAEADDDSILIDPKGPRSFGEEDSAYFLRLLPGGRDRNGLPPGVKFWKVRVDSQDPATAIKVGLIHGPSGCGKSSRVKAALLPRLEKTVVAVYLESSADETVTKLLGELHAKVPALPKGIGLVEAMGAIRRGQYLPAGKKLTLFFDQFEQWLHANQAEETTDLVQALRQCDGVRLQCIIMIRSEFQLAAERFLGLLDVKVEEWKNARLIDLFDQKHARDVLILFGQAMRALPRDRAALGKDHNEFLDRAVEGLSQNKLIVCVRLALFAEMVRYKEWIPATLDAVGGIGGIGETYLEETFCADHALDQYKNHQQSAQRVLRSLLPLAGSDIKGHRRSLEQLREASEYTHEPERFDDLIRILDNELRLITPTDPVRALSEAKKDGTGTHAILAGEKHYQLAHDYLVPSLREWLNRKNKETRQGRAELLLEECAHEWKEKCENRHLPSLIQWAKILSYVPQRRRRDETQYRMIRRANRYYAVRMVFTLVLLLAVGVGANEIWQREQADSMRKQILKATTAEVPGIVKNSSATKSRLNPRLHQSLAEAEMHGDTRMMMNISLALLHDEPERADFLFERLLEAEPRNIAVLISSLNESEIPTELPDEKRKTLGERLGAVREQLWSVAIAPNSDVQKRLRASAALAKYEPNSPEWDRIATRIVEDLDHPG